jgi:hypothetical protein
LEEECKVAYGEPPNSNFEHYYKITCLVEIETIFSTTPKDLAKEDISISDLYIIVQQAFRKQDEIFKVMLNKIEIKIGNKILALHKENRE